MDSLERTIIVRAIRSAVVQIDMIKQLLDSVAVLMADVAEALEQDAPPPGPPPEPRPYPERPSRTVTPPAKPVTPSTTALLTRSADDMLTVTQAADYLGLKRTTLGAYRRQDRGPTFVTSDADKRNPYLYRLGDLRQWAMDHGGKVKRHVLEHEE